MDNWQHRLHHLGRWLVPRQLGAGEGTRTPNPLFTKQELYRLSYANARPRSGWPGGHSEAMTGCSVVKTVYVHEQAWRELQRFSGVGRALATPSGAAAPTPSECQRRHPTVLRRSNPCPEGSQWGPRTGPGSGSAGPLGCQAQFIPNPPTILLYLNSVVRSARRRQGPGSTFLET